MSQRINDIGRKVLLYRSDRMVSGEMPGSEYHGLSGSEKGTGVGIS